MVFQDVESIHGRDVKKNKSELMLTWNNISIGAVNLTMKFADSLVQSFIADDHFVSFMARIHLTNYHGNVDSFTSIASMKTSDSRGELTRTFEKIFTLMSLFEMFLYEATQSVEKIFAA